MIKIGFLALLLLCDGCKGDNLLTMAAVMGGLRCRVAALGFKTQHIKLFPLPVTTSHLMRAYQSSRESTDNEQQLSLIDTHICVAIILQVYDFLSRL
jgi:hypothetical protein